MERTLEFGQALAALRRNAGITQKLMATALVINFQEIVDYENGKARPTTRVLYSMSQHYFIPFTLLDLACVGAWDMPSTRSNSM